MVKVTIAGGTLRGVGAAGVDRFLGIPFGTSTAGHGRFKKASPAWEWKGVREATFFGASAPQVDPRLDTGGTWAEILELMYPRGGTPLEGGEMSENCLFLNVWAPTGSEPGSLPVIVWFHGGGFVHGTGSESLFNGAALAQSRRAVVVTVNHRLGVLGYLALGHLLGEEYELSGIVGLTDLVLALEWVRENILSFGGDPGNVTISGQSGGASKVSMLMAMPSARGLFHKAILQSGNLLRPLIRPKQSADTTAAVLDVFGLHESNVDLLLDLPASQLLDRQRRFTRSIATFRPTVHPQMLPHHAVKEGVESLDPGVPVLIGNTTHDMALMLTEEADYLSYSYDDARRRFVEIFGDQGERQFLDLRDEHPDESPQLLIARAETERSYGLSSGVAADRFRRMGHNVYKYEFRFQTDVDAGSEPGGHGGSPPAGA